jgi:prephenate dehydrogenase
MIALLTLLGAIGLMVYLFAGSRQDPSLRIAALVAGTGLVSALAAIASPILTGKDLTKPRDPADMPPNTTTTDTSTVKVGPVPPIQPADPAQLK